jgi:hypothetical protein
MAERLLSYTEVETALTCWARHAFQYTGHLTGGDTLRPRTIPTVLSEGRAWGSAVAAWHSGGQTLLSHLDAAEALRTSLDADELEMVSRGVHMSANVRTESEERLNAILAHYIATTVPLDNLSRLEDEVIVGIPSRGGKHASTRYRFQARIDGWTLDDQGRPWLVEFKLRGQLMSVHLMQTSRQLRWYAWALRQAKGIEPIGVLVDERLNEVPRSPRVVKAKRKGEGRDGLTVSHATNQLITAADYVRVCADYDSEPSDELLDHLNRIVWQQRVPLIFRPGELDEAGRELTAAAKLIRDLDSGELQPIRHATPGTCGRCRFREICPNPGDDLYVDTLYERSLPKRVRPPVAA